MHVQLGLLIENPLPPGASGVTQSIAVFASLVLYYFCVSWWLREKSAARATVAQYGPPDGMSPGTVRYLMTGNSDAKTLAVVVLGLAARGLVSIEPQRRFFSITKRSDHLPSDLPDEEKAAFDAMFNGVVRYKSILSGATYEQAAPREDRFLWDPVEGTGAAELAFAVHRSLRKRIEGTYFTRNPAYVLPALVISVFLIVRNAAGMESIRMGEPVAPFLGQLIVTLHIAAAALLIGYLPRADEILRGRVQATGEVKLLVAALYGYLCVVALIFAGYSFGYYALVLIALVNIFLSARLLRTPTRSGSLKLAELEGFRQFLTTVELDRFNRLLPLAATSLSLPNLTYALAFDLEGVWADFLGVCGLEPIVIGGRKIPANVLTR